MQNRDVLLGRAATYGRNDVGNAVAVDVRDDRVDHAGRVRHVNSLRNQEARAGKPMSSIELNGFRDSAAKVVFIFGPKSTFIDGRRHLRRGVADVGHAAAERVGHADDLAEAVQLVPRSVAVGVGEDRGRRVAGVRRILGGRYLKHRAVGAD